MKQKHKIFNIIKIKSYLKLNKKKLVRTILSYLSLDFLLKYCKQDDTSILYIEKTGLRTQKSSERTAAQY
ncbi:hypothetical protein BgiBS90_022385, partial [Biomphalaria glabrata]